MYKPLYGHGAGAWLCANYCKFAGIANTVVEYTSGRIYKRMGLEADAVYETAATGKWHIFEGRYREKFLGLFSRQRYLVRVLSRDGVVSLQREAWRYSYN